MRLLLDANLSPHLTELLTAAGFDALHVADLTMLRATDAAIFDYAQRSGLVIVTADTDFPMLLALRRASSPSVVLLRRVAHLGPDAHSRLLTANLQAVDEDLERGAVVSLSPTRLAVRDLPLR